ncbi:FAD-binding domain-containing protein [Henriciella litoralis]|uniref:FAD-binding domain-containing protein n=1 Tax=Henriciella litoralis TaxID=568102 RepID=UPI001F2C9F79|nr:FAD-binding domain-containing protein [Henriciella litoralis]
MSTGNINSTRETALKMLNYFVPNMGEVYASQRNIDFGRVGRTNVSCLSPFLRHRLISEREVAAAALEAYGFEASHKYLQELCWRTYFKGWLEHRPGVWTAYCAERDQLFASLESDTETKEAYERAIAGKTGIDGFDTWASELIETGYLHNHARMSFASIWMFTLKLPWQLGAEFLLRHLMDGDPASNTLSWRWIGGLHTEGKTYLASHKAIEVCSNGRFSPDNLATQADPVGGAANPEPEDISPADGVPSGRFALLLTEDDLSPETMLGKEADIAAIAGVSSAELRSPHGAGEKASAFTSQAMTDALSRASKVYCVDTVDFSETASLTDDIHEWAQSLDTDQIAIPWVPVGWSRDRMIPVLADLENRGLTISYLRRPWDDIFWPHTTAGYFKLRKKLPRLFDEAGLEGVEGRV